jgi:ABC-2 type transport system ATP-binding protein
VIAGESVIAIDRLAKTYRSYPWSGRSIAALRGVSLNVSPGEIFGLLGPNGAGKTTLIKILLGVVRASGGTASLLGHPAGSANARQRVGYLPESLRIDRHHTARSALRFYGRMSRLSSQEIESRMDDLLRLVGLDGRDREAVRRFSKGMYQRLGLAQALLHDPSLLILDEPTDGLDPVGRSEVRRLLLELKQRGKTIFLNSHILQEVELVCDRVAIMSHGEVKGVGSIDELTQSVSGREVVIDVEIPPEAVRLGTSCLSMAQSLKSELTPLLSNEMLNTRDSQSLALTVDAMPEERMRIKFLCNNLRQTDAVVDFIRDRNLSLIGLRTNRRSLEDVFLSLVGNESSAEPQTEEAIDQANPTVADPPYHASDGRDRD